MSDSSPGNRARSVRQVLLQQRWLHFLLLATLMTLLAAAMQRQHWGWAEALDTLALDISFKFRPVPSPAQVAEVLPSTQDIVMVELSHPLPRKGLADLLWSLREAKVVGLDLMLVEQTAEFSDEESQQYADEFRLWKRGTAALTHVMGCTGNVVLGTWSDEDWRPDGPHGTFVRERVWGRPAIPLWEKAHYHGHLLIAPDTQGVVHQAPLFQDVTFSDGTRKRLPCFALALAAASCHYPPAQLEAELCRLSPHGGVLHLGPWQVPYDEQGLLTIEYVGARQCFEYGENRVVHERVRQLYTPQTFAGKVVIVGESSPTSHDFYNTPYELMSGMQIHANILATIRTTGFSPCVLPFWLVSALAWGCCLLLMLPLVRWPLWCSCLVLLLECVAIICGSAWWHVRTHTLFPVSIPVMAVILTYNAVALYEYGRIRFTLSRFIGPDMVKRALHLFTRLRLGAGAVEEASAMFCDLRGYVTLSESLAPEAMAAFVNAYTDSVVAIVRRYHGRPVDYAGDGVFVLFEASLAGRQHAAQAVRAALDVRQAFDARRAQWAAQGLPEVELGIAIDTGKMMIGLLGSEHYLKLGAIGDVVNVAARVQRLSRQCGYEVLVTRATYQHMAQAVPADYCGTFALIGRAQPVEIYGVSASRIISSARSD